VGAEKDVEVVAAYFKVCTPISLEGLWKTSEQPSRKMWHCFKLLLVGPIVAFCENGGEPLGLSHPDESL